MSTVNSLALFGASCDATFPVWRTRAASCLSFRDSDSGTLPRNAEPPIAIEENGGVHAARF